MPVVGSTVVAVFGIGTTWGIMKTKQRAITGKINDAVEKLEGTVKSLTEIASEVKVMTAVSARVEEQLSHHADRISAIEIGLAKLQGRIQTR